MKSDKRLKKIKDYILLYFAFLIYSFASVFSKISAMQSSVYMMIFFLLIEVCFLGFYALVWQQVLKKFDLLVAIANKGITVLLAFVWSILIFRESVTVKNIIGIGLILFGIWMVSSDG